MINFKALETARERMEDSIDGKFGRCGNWKIALGGYDMGYEVYYKNFPVMRVNYELDKYEFYSCDYEDVMFTPETIPQIKKALGITPMFDNVGGIDDNGDYIDRFDKYVNVVEARKMNNKMKFKKIMKNESEQGNSDNPRIYVSTYAKYNDGSLEGEWVDLTDFDTYEDFVDYCSELHKDENDPEFMVQDFENFPKKWYHESGLPTEDEFNKINEYYLMSDIEKSAYETFIDYTDNEDIDDFHEAYQGQFESASDFAYDLVDSLGWDGIGSNAIDMYFDYDAFGRDIMMDYHIGDEDNEDAYGNPEDPDHYYDNDGYDMGEYESDNQVARDYVDGLGGVDQLGADTARNYFDYDAFGRDLLMSDYFEADGFVFRHI